MRARACPRAPGRCRCRRPRAACRGPDTCPPATRAFTTQKRVPSRQVALGVLHHARAARRRPRGRAGASPPRPDPTSTSLYLTFVLPASRPLGRLEADRDRRARAPRGCATPRSAPTTAATSGISHTIEGGAPLCVTTASAGVEIPAIRSCSSVMSLLASLRSQIRRGSKDSAASIVSTTTAPKKTAPSSASIVASGAEVDQRHQDRDDEDVHHRPAARSATVMR